MSPSSARASEADARAPFTIFPLNCRALSKKPVANSVLELRLWQQDKSAEGRKAKPGEVYRLLSFSASWSRAFPERVPGEYPDVQFSSLCEPETWDIRVHLAWHIQILYKIGYLEGQEFEAKFFRSYRKIHIFLPSIYDLGNKCQLKIVIILWSRRWLLHFCEFSY